MENNKTIRNTSVLGFLFTAVIGTLLHFAFEASGGDLLVGVFSPVNESIWEHQKLLLVPVLLYAVVEYLVYGKDFPSFITVKVLSMICGMLLIVCGYYTYTGIIGQRFIAVDVGLFYCATALVYLMTYLLCRSGRYLTKESQSIAALLVLTVIILSFIYFTYHPPMLELFRDPVTEDFGIAATLPYI